MLRKMTGWILLAAMLLPLAACGAKEEVSADNGTAAADTTVETEPVGYDYQGKNYEGATFTILNYDTYCKTNLRIVPDETTGESLNDAMVNRNKKVEDELNIKLVEQQAAYASLGGWDKAQPALCDMVITAVIAGDTLYDAAYLPVYWKPSIITDGYLVDLRSVPEIRLGEEWWDNGIIDSLTIQGKSFLGSSPLSLQTLDLSWCLLFNEKMMDDNHLAYPYDLVREGKWTLDKFSEYINVGTNLNGDTSYTLTSGGKCVYGVNGHADSITAAIAAAGNRLVSQDGKGNFTIAIDTERLYNTIERVGEIYSASLGHMTYDTNAASEFFYEKLFRERRGLFLTCEIKACLELRDMEDNFGMIPFPKYDEAQEEYYTLMGQSTCVLTLPIVQKDLSRTGFILDALSYESYASVMDTYYYTTLSQKGLRNQDSEEMLDIIRRNWITEFGQFFGITTAYCTKIRDMIRAEQNTASSQAATYKPTIQQSIEDVVAAFNRQ